MTATTANGERDAPPSSHSLAKLAARSGPQALLYLAVALALSGAFSLLVGVEDGDRTVMPAQHQFVEEALTAVEEAGP